MEQSTAISATQTKKGVHIMVKMPSGTEMHEFILPVGYTVDQVKRAIFKQIPDLAKETNPSDYQLKLRDTRRSKEEILNVEFNKLQNLDTVKSATDEDTPFELSIFSTKMAPGRGRHNLEHAETISALPIRRNLLKPPFETPSRTSASSFASPISPRDPVYSRPTAVRSTSSSALKTLPGLDARQNEPAKQWQKPPQQQQLPQKEQQQEQQKLEEEKVAALTAELQARGDAIKSLQVQLEEAQSSIKQLNRKLEHIKNMVRLGLADQDAGQPAEAKTERMSMALKQVLAEIEHAGTSSTAGTGAGADKNHHHNHHHRPHSSSNASKKGDDTLFRLPASAGGQAALAVLGAGGEGKQSGSLRMKNEDNKRHRTKSIDSIAARMNLEVPPQLASSTSSCGATPEGSASPSPMPPRKTLTPEERTEMLQQEFLDTEEGYLKSLQKMHDFFEVPLEASGLLTPEQCDTLFSRVRVQMLEIHKHLLKTLKERPPGTSFSDSLLTIAPYLKLYTEYVNNHPQATSLLMELNATSKKFSALLKQLELRPEVEAQDLSSFLIRPIQRLPRYELLLRDMVKYTTEETEHLKLSRLLESVRNVNEHLNEAKRKRDNANRMAIIQSTLILGKSTKQFSLFSSQTRMFVREDTLLVRKVKKEKAAFFKHHFFLFSDIMLNTIRNKEGKFKLHQVYKLNEISVQKYEGDSETVALFLTSSEATMDDAIHVKADQGGDIVSWLQDVLNSKARLRAAETEESKDGRLHIML